MITWTTCPDTGQTIMIDPGRRTPPAPTLDDQERYTNMDEAEEAYDD